MTAICLLTCAFTMGQSDPGWQLAPHLDQGLELNYTGTYREEVLVPGVQFQRSYRLEATVFVLDGRGNESDVAFQTVLSLRSNRRDSGSDAAKEAPSSVRLEIGHVDKRGRLRGQRAALSVSLDGPPTIETGIFLELPRTAVGRHQVWEVGDEGRPPRTWQVIGTEFCNGTTCVKIAGVQQSSDWDQPRGDNTAWRRRDTIWLGPQLGVAYRVERIIERREPNRRDPTQRSEVRYELDSRLRYPGKLFEDRRHEIMKAVQFRGDAVKPLAQPAVHHPQIEILLKKIAYHMENVPPTPYRRAIVHLQSQLERAGRDELPSEPIVEEPAATPTTVRTGQRAPDFVVTDLSRKESSVRLYRNLGRPVLIVFYNPATETGREVLEFSRRLLERNRSRVSILAMAVTDDAELARRQHARLKLPFPVLDGHGLHTTFGVQETPRIVLLDRDGVVRGGYTGWGIQTPGDIEKELGRWLVSD